MKSSFDLEKALRILKSKGVPKGEVARTINITPGYLSKMISGEKPVTQSVVDTLLKEYKSILEGEELIEFIESDVIAAQIAMQATIDTQGKLILMLVSEIAELKKVEPDKYLREFIEKTNPALERIFDEIVEDAATQLLKKRGQA